MAKETIPIQTQERQTLDTVDQIDNWLNNEAVGNSPYAAAYLDKMRSLISYSNEHKGPSDSTAFSAHLLAGMIGRKSEARYQQQLTQPSEIPGVIPVREVTDGDILGVVTEFSPDHPNYKGYASAEDAWRVHQVIDEVVRQEVSHEQQAQWQVPPSAT